MIPHRLWTILCSALLCSASVHAQTTATQGPVALQGTVRSDQEGAMEGVLVSAKRAGATITTTVITDAQGHYAFPASRLQPGRYAITIRAVGYRLKDSQAADVTAGAAASADIVLDKVTDLHQLADQLTNADWLNSMPGNGFGCAGYGRARPFTGERGAISWILGNTARRPHRGDRDAPPHQLPHGPGPDSGPAPPRPA